MNPYIKSRADVLNITAGVISRANRAALIGLCQSNARGLLSHLRKVESKTAAEVAADPNLQTALELKSETLAMWLTAQRHHMRYGEDETGGATASGGGECAAYDPRLLVFEFAHSMVLRASQVALIETFITKVRGGGSICHQMIMGAGKTTVVGPLLALMMADGECLVVQVVPFALLAMSRSVVREKFSAVIRKSVYTFRFDRYTTPSRALVKKLERARNTKSIVCAPPTAIKSFMLKFIELMHLLDQSEIASGQVRSSVLLFASTCFIFFCCSSTLLFALFF